MTIIVASERMPRRQFVVFDPTELRGLPSYVEILPIGRQVGAESGLEDVYEIWNRSRAQWLRLVPGDYVDITEMHDVTPVERAHFKAHFEEHHAGGARSIAYVPRRAGLAHLLDEHDDTAEATD